MKQSHIWSLLALILLVGSLTSGGVLLARRAEVMRGWENAADPGATLPLRIPRPGVNVELTQYDAEALREQLADIAASGVVWVRQTFPWAEIEPRPGEYVWTRWDAIVEAVSQQPELRLVAVLNLAPRWARHPLAPDHPTAPPADNADFGRFARRFAERYGGQIDYYQVWDEPNLTDAWGGLEPEAADYVALLQAAYRAIHDADGTATVIMAGLAPTLETGPRNYSDVLFLRAIYANGGGSAFDAAAGKPYGFEFGPDDRRVDEHLMNFSRLILLREEMVRQGDAHKALWATQFGWNALPDNWSGRPSIWQSVSREQQLAYITAAYARAEREWPWLGGLIVQHWQPDVQPDDPQWGFSLLAPGENRAVLPNLFAPASESLAAGPGRHHPVSPFADYSGAWEFGEIGADFGMDGDSEVTFAFTGTDLALELRRDNYRAYLYVTVDDQPAALLPRDGNGRSYIILTSDDLLPHTDVIPLAHGLNSGRHTVHLLADRGWDQWALAAFRVGNTPDTTTEDLLLVAVLLVALTSAVGLISMARRGLVRRVWPLIRELVSRVNDLVLAATASVLVMVGMLLTWGDVIPNLVRRDPPGLLLGILTAGALYLSPSLLLTVIAAIVLWGLIYHRLELGMILTIFWAPYFLFPVELYQRAFAMAEVCLLLTASAWAVQQAIRWAQTFRSGQRRLRPAKTLYRLNALDWGMLLFVGLALLSVSWSAHRPEALREWRTLILEPALFYLVARTTVQERETVVRLVDTLLLSAALSALIGLGLYLSGQGIITAEQDTVRLAGVYGSPNNVGLFMGRVFPFALAYLLLPTGKVRRVLATLAGAVMLGAVALSQSAGAILLGIPAAIVVVLALWNARRGLLAIVGMSVLGLFALIPLSQFPRFARLLDFSSGTTFFRLRLWQSAVQMILDRPLQGFGLDQFLYAYRGHYILPEAWQEPNLSHPHNILLDFWTRLGLGGVLLLIWFQVNFWRAAWRIYRRTDTPLLRAVVIGMMGSMANLLTHGLVDNSVFVYDLSYVFALLIALPGLLQAMQVDSKPQT